MSVPLANLNGVMMPLTEAKVPVLDRAFLFGDAIYEVLRVYAGKPWLEAEHFARLARSLDAIRIAGVDVERLRRRSRSSRSTCSRISPALRERSFAISFQRCRIAALSSSTTFTKHAGRPSSVRRWRRASRRFPRG